jgi:hypothetical protein
MNNDNDDTMAPETVVVDAVTVNREALPVAWSVDDLEEETQPISTHGRTVSVILVGLVGVVLVAGTWLGATFIGRMPSNVAAPLAPTHTALPPKVTVTEPPVTEPPVTKPPVTVTQTPTSSEPVASDPDSTFLGIFARSGYTVGPNMGQLNPQIAITDGHAVCENMAERPNVSRTEAAETVSRQISIPIDAANVLVAASIAVYCPELHGR